MPKGIYLANKLLDEDIGGVAYSPPGTLYVALFLTLPAADGTGGTEVSTSGTGYSRLAKTNNLTNFPSAVTGGKTNGVAFTWSALTAAIGPVAGVAIVDAASGAFNLHYYGPLFAQISFAIGAQPSFPAGTLAFSET